MRLTKKKFQGKTAKQNIGRSRKKIIKDEKKIKTFIICTHFCLETANVKTMLMTEIGEFPLTPRF